MQAKPVGGFTLIEVLVAILVLAIGVLGAAGAQLAALQTRQETGLMSAGVQLAGSLADRMRANVQQVRAGDALNPYLQLNYDALADGPPAPPGALCFAGTDCNSAQMAAFDVYEITQALHAGFPGGRVTVCRDAVIVARGGATLGWPCAGGLDAPIVIKLGWRSRGADAGDGASFAPSVAIVAGASS
ncbi:MAG: type IV pilus modification protein PilV [Massilia sp.]|nr:type IV pilus modification protein PilV [Massilia sp.]